MAGGDTTQPFIPGGHTVGATIEGLRVPDQFKGQLVEMLAVIRSGDFNPVSLIGTISEMLSQASTADGIEKEEHDRGIFSDNPNFGKRFQPDYGIVGKISETMKLTGHPVVMTSGTYDLVHIGHARYLACAKQYGDFLIVGVDSDEKVRAKKGTHRPIVPQSERLAMLAHIRGVDLITLKGVDDEKWELIKTVRPNTLIATEGTYNDNQVAELEANWVDRVVVLPPQAERSTSAIVRLGNIAAESYVADNLRKILEETAGLDPLSIDGIIARLSPGSSSTWQAQS